MGFPYVVRAGGELLCLQDGREHPFFMGISLFEDVAEMVPREHNAVLACAPPETLSATIFESETPRNARAPERARPRSCNQNAF